MAEFVLSLAELPVLLNILTHTGNDAFRLRSSILQQDLFTFDLEEGKIKRLIKKAEFQRSYEELTGSVGDNERDQGQRQDSNIIPPFKILRRCLIGAGLWEME
ncbi:MAG: hypothetical protein ACTSRC_19450, partial [Candidatus Helarchaeota archaeon]